MPKEKPYGSKTNNTNTEESNGKMEALKSVDITYMGLFALNLRPYDPKSLPTLGYLDPLRISLSTR